MGDAEAIRIKSETMRVKKCCLICERLGYNIVGHFCVLTTEIKEGKLTDLCDRFKLKKELNDS